MTTWWVLSSICWAWVLGTSVYLDKDIKKLMDIKKGNSISDFRNTLIIVISFYVLLRADELRNIKVGHVFHENHVEITIPKSNMDQLQQGNTW